MAWLCCSFALGLAMAPLCGCSLYVDTGRTQCGTKEDCVARGFRSMVCTNNLCEEDNSNDRWGCVGSVKWPSGSTSQPSITVAVMDVMTMAPPAGLQVRACPKLDVNCTTPADGVLAFDGQGRVVMTVGAGFDGYLEITGDSITPALFFVTRPVWQDTVVQNVLPVVSPQGFHGIAQALGTTLDLTNNGHVYALVGDCNDAAAEGVRLELDRETAGTTPYYMINNAPIGTAPFTDASGSGGFLNLKTGFASTTGYVAATGARIGKASFIVRAGAVSYPRVIPTP